MAETWKISRSYGMETCVQLGLTQSPIAYPKVNLSYEDFQLPAYSDGAV